MTRPTHSARKVLDRLRSNEPAGPLANDLGVRDAEVVLARDLVRHVGEHQAPAAGRLPDVLAQAVVEAALQIEHAGFLKAVAEYGSKAAASAARRGLAILRSRGIEVDVEPTGEAVFKTAAPLAEELACYLSSPSSTGERAVWIPRALRGGGVQLLTVLVSDVAGILHVAEADISRKELRRFQDDLRRPQGITIYEIPHGRALGVLAEARAPTRSLNIEAAALLANLEGDPARAAPATASEPPFAPAVEAERLRTSGELHSEPEVRGWRPDTDAIRSLALRLDEIATSQLYVDEHQREAQVAREVDRAVAAAFAGERGARYARRLFELAEALRVTGRGAAAERALAAARALVSGVEPSAIPFCRALVEKLLPATGGAPQQTAGGLVMPADPGAGG